MGRSGCEALRGRLVAQGGRNLFRRGLQLLQPVVFQPVRGCGDGKARDQLGLVVIDAGGHATHAQFQFLVVPRNAVLARLVATASNDPLLRELSTSPSHQVEVGHRTLEFHTTNRLVKNPSWDIVLQKTGYISEAGQCLVMSAKVAGRKLIMVFLDSAGKLSRIADAGRVRKWVETHSPTGVPLPAAGTSTVIRQVSG